MCLVSCIGDSVTANLIFHDFDNMQTYTHIKVINIICLDLSNIQTYKHIIVINSVRLDLNNIYTS